MRPRQQRRVLVLATVRTDRRARAPLAWPKASGGVGRHLEADVHDVQRRVARQQCLQEQPLGIAAEGFSADGLATVCMDQPPVGRADDVHNHLV